jgi:hypothetical protein
LPSCPCSCIRSKTIHHTTRFSYVVSLDPRLRNLLLHGQQPVAAIHAARLKGHPTLKDSRPRDWDSARKGVKFDTHGVVAIPECKEWMHDCNALNCPSKC